MITFRQYLDNNTRVTVQDNKMDEARKVDRLKQLDALAGLMIDIGGLTRKEIAHVVKVLKRAR